MLYIMRHGKTQWNEDGLLQGRTDIPLNEEGRVGAINVMDECRTLDFDICYCSPLLRAEETAKIALSGTDVPIVFDDRLLEMCFGICEGKDFIHINEDNPMYAFFNEPEKYVPASGAESFQELFARTGEFLEEIIFPQIKEGKRILIVGHGAMNSSIISQIRGYSLSQFWDAGIPNCRLIKVMD